MAGLFRSPDEAQQAYAAPLRLGACFGLRAFGGDDRDLPRLGGITPQFPGTMLNSLLCRLAVQPLGPSHAVKLRSGLPLPFLDAVWFDGGGLQCIR